MTRQRLHGRVDMIGHDHKRMHPIPLALKMQEDLAEDVPQLRIAQPAPAVAGVEFLLQSFHCLALQLLALLAAPRIMIGPPPGCVHLTEPVVPELPGQRVLHPEGEEVGRALLPPVGQVPMLNGQLLIPREALEVGLRGYEVVVLE